MKIIAFVTHPQKIWSILKRIGWPTETPNFDPPFDLNIWSISQLIPGTSDGFPVEEFCHTQNYFEADPDPPQFKDGVDPPHWEETHYIIYD